MTNHDLVCKVLRGLIRQGKPSYGELAPGCTGYLYRSEDGTKCAIGLLIKDNLLLPRYNGLDSHDSLITLALLKSGIHRAQFDLVEVLRDIHDEAARDYQATNEWAFAVLKQCKRARRLKSPFYRAVSLREIREICMRVCMRTN